MAYVLRELLKIRLMREQWAKDALVKAQNVLQLAIRKVEEKKKELEDFRVWRVGEEKRLYAEVMRKRVKRNDIDALKLNLADLEKKELGHIQAIHDAEEEREKAKDKVEEARVAYNFALIGVQKLEEHKVGWMAEWTKEQEALVEKEMEDFKVLKVDF